MRKKILITISLVVLIEAFCLQNVFAAGPALSIQEAKDAVSLAVSLRESIGFHFLWYQGGTLLDIDIDIKDCKIFDKTWSNGVTYGVLMAPIKDGYDPDSVKNMVKKAYSKDLSAQILQNNKAFFDDYRYDEGIYYYYYDRGAVVSVHEVAAPIDITAEDIDALTIVSNSDGNAVVSLSAKRDPIGNQLRNFPRITDIEIQFYLTYEDGAWKVSGGNFHNMIFSLCPGEDAQDSRFTEEIALDAIKAAVYDGYYFNTLAPVSQLLTYGIYGEKRNNVRNIYEPEHSTEERKHLNFGTWWELEGNLSDPKAWNEYFDHYCTENVMKKLLTYDRRLRQSDGKIFVKGGYGSITDHYEFDLANVTKEKLTVNNASDSAASATFKFTIDDKTDIPLNFDFVKENGEWKISGGDFLEKLDANYLSEVETFDPYRVPNKSTGDTGITAAVIVGVTALIVMALTVIIKKRVEPF